MSTHNARDRMPIARAVPFESRPKPAAEGKVAAGPGKRRQKCQIMSI
jgi:hypothetical protein